MDRKKARPRHTTVGQILLFNKPFDVLSQFTDDNPAVRGAERRQTLADFISTKEIYPCGRLDRDSEGLLLLTADGRLQAKISNPRFNTRKTYLAQLDGEIDAEALHALQHGITLKDGPARASAVSKIEQPEWLWDRNPPIRYRKNSPTSWISMTLTEGRNRQVRRMTANVGFPTLRLIRTRVGNCSITGLQPGQSKWTIASAFFD